MAYDPHEAQTSSKMEGRHTIGVRSGMESEGTTGDKSTSQTQRGKARRKKKGGALAEMIELIRQQITFQMKQHELMMLTMSMMQQQVIPVQA